VDQRDTFDTVADLYAEARPGYPAALYDDLAEMAGLGPDASVLEVGCGPGQATRDLAARARRIVALDPGANLVAEARRAVQAPNVEWVVGRLETYAPARGAFDLVASAQAWHWVDPAVRFAKAADALRAHGALAVWGHTPLAPPEPFASAFKAIYDRRLPGAWGTPPGSAAYLPGGPFPAMFDASGLFEPVEHRAYAWTWSLDGETFGRYLRTDSSYRFMDDAARFALFDELAGAVDAVGAPLPYPWQTTLYVAHKR
jgi:SAM-dependent methyltransferase